MRMLWKSPVLATSAAITLGFTVGCNGDDNGSPMSPSAAPAATVTITANGVSPREVSVGLNDTVRFVNNDSVSHEIQSNPHPVHSDCPPISQVGLVTPGRSGTTGPLTFQGACGYHDHLLQDTGGGEPFRGVILVATTDTETPPVGY